jgi:hypothetical protein
MKKKIQRAAIGFLLVITLISLSNIVSYAFEFGSVSEEENIEEQLTIVAARRTEKEGEEQVSFENKGTEPCYVRVKLLVPSVEEQEIFEIGMIDKNRNLKQGFDERAENESWEERDGYIYYKNKKTANKLLPGEKTPVIYSMFHPSLALESAASEMIYQNCEIILCAEAAAADKEEWEAWREEKEQEILNK